MPTYLCHGFTWKRHDIREFVIMQDLDDGAPDWIIAPRSAAAILTALAKKYPYIPSAALAETNTSSESSSSSSSDQSSSALRLLEEYSAADETTWTRPHAYVADHVVEVKLGVDVAEEMERYRARTDAGEEGWFERLRGEMRGAGDALRWYVVVCEDEVRAYEEG